jgi:hypothetical protein
MHYKVNIEGQAYFLIQKSHEMYILTYGKLNIIIGTFKPKINESSRKMAYTSGPKLSVEDRLNQYGINCEVIHTYI